MKKRLLACALAATMILGSTAPVLAADDGSTQGTNTFVDGGTDLSFWTFQELHVGFWTSMADEWNKQNPDRPINLTVTTGESSSLHSKFLLRVSLEKEKVRCFYCTHRSSCLLQYSLTGFYIIIPCNDVCRINTSFVHDVHVIVSNCSS